MFHFYVDNKYEYCYWMNENKYNFVFGKLKSNCGKF